MARLGLVTVGQAPRVDMVPEMTRHWDGVDLHEQGALDDLTPADVLRTIVRAGDEVLTARMRDGSAAIFGRDLVLPRLQHAITALEDGGADAVLLLCTGEFPAFTHRRPLYLASHLLTSGVEALARGPIGVICPLPEQQADCRGKFAALDVLTAAASPYAGEQEDFVHAACSLIDRGATLLVLDCMGYGERHRVAIRAAAPSVPVIVARSLVSRLVAEAVAA